MIDRLRHHGFLLLVTMCGLLAVVGLFFRAETGPEAVPFMYPLLALVAVTVVVLVVRLLTGLLEMPRGDDDAD